MNFANKAHGKPKGEDPDEVEEKAERKPMSKEKEMKGKQAKPASKGMDEPEGEGGDDAGDIGDVVELHGPAHEISVKSDHAAGTHNVTSIHGEKKHSKTYSDPMEAMRHVHVAAGLGEPMQQQPQPAMGGGQNTMEMLQHMGRPAGMQGL